MPSPADHAELDKPILNHVGMIVADRDATIARLKPVLGFGEVFPLDMEFESVLVRGEPRSFALRAAFISLGETYLELLEPLDDRSLHAEVLAERGETFHHLCFGVDDLDAHIERFEAQSRTRLVDATGPESPARWIYLESPSGDVIELFERSADSEALFEQIAATVKGS